MGEVYKARDTRLDRLVALKMLRTDKLGVPERNRRFVQEARTASALNHPNSAIRAASRRRGSREVVCRSF